MKTQDQVVQLSKTNLDLSYQHQQFHAGILILGNVFVSQGSADSDTFVMVANKPTLHTSVPHKHHPYLPDSQELQDPRPDLTTHPHIHNTDPLPSLPQETLGQGPLPHNSLTTIGKTPVKTEIISQLTAHHPDQNEVRDVIHSIQNGFDLHYEGPRYPSTAENMHSVNENKAYTQDKIDQFIMKDWVAGPFDPDDPSLPSNLIISPIGLIPKSDDSPQSPNDSDNNSMQFRLIMNLSAPNSINQHIDKELCKVKYASFDQAVQLALKMGKGAYQAKLDVKSAFNLLPVRIQDLELLGFKFNDKIYVQKMMPQGLSYSCKAWERFGNILDWIIQNETKSTNFVRYMDDIYICCRTEDQCRILMDKIMTTLTILGIPINHDKTVFPTQIITFLGLGLDTQKQEITVPLPKRIKANILLGEMIQKYQSKKKVRVRMIYHVAGFLQFLVKANPNGRCFLKRLYESTKGQQKYHHVRISEGIYLDLLTWKQFIDQYKGATMFLHPDIFYNSAVEFWTDSSRFGFGIMFQNNWAYGSFPQFSSPPSMTYLEMVPILIGLHLYGDRMANRHILFISDNMGVVEILNSQTSKSHEIMHLLRMLVQLCMKHNIVFKSKFIGTSFNSLCDSLSRFNFQKFRSLCPPTTNKHPDQIPQHLLHMIAY